jgi:hypothetical protein
MPGLRTRSALVLLGVFLCLAACAPFAAVSQSPTATTPPARTPTPTIALAPTAASIPAGWQVLDTQYFSIAYPSDWTTEMKFGDRYFIWAPAKQSQVIVQADPQGDVSPYCEGAISGAQHTTFAGLPMTYVLTGQGNDLRTWMFANSQHTFYTLAADDSQVGAALQTEDTTILSTFRPNNTDPWAC